MNTETMFSSKKDDWETPQDFFNELNKEFRFTLDPASDCENHKCSQYYTKKQDGLKQSWEGKTVFCNPPYGRQIGRWIPVTKLLPEMFETVQITAKMPADTDSLVYQGAMVGKDKWELDGVGNPEDYKVTAWKPLPEPYKGE